MKYKIELQNRKLWIVGRHMLQPGVYRVPEDLSEELAQLAMRKGIGVKVAELGAPEIKAPKDLPPDPTSSPGPQSGGSGQAEQSRSSPADQASLTTTSIGSGAATRRKR